MDTGLRVRRGVNSALRPAGHTARQKGKTMATFKHENACACEAVDAFGGIDRTGFIGRLSEAWDIDNFRILCDGSIEKREGYELRCTLSSPVDAVTAVPGDGGRIYVLSGGQVYIITLSEGTARLLGRAADVAGGCFTAVGGETVVIAGGNIHTVRPSGLFPVDGYVPLYGRDWSESGGQVYQSRNLLSNRVRLSYTLSAPSVLLETGLDGFSVDSLTVDGSPLDTAYARGGYICLPASFPEGTKIEACIVFDSDCDDTDALLSCTGALTFGRDGFDCAVCYGGAANALFCSAAVTAQELAASRACRPGSQAVYFPESGRVDTGLTGAPVSVTGNADALLVSDSVETHLLTSDGEERVLFGAPGAAGAGICVGDAAYVASGRGLYRFELKSGAYACLSEPLDGAVELGAEPVLGYDPRYGELLISPASDTAGRVAVYSIPRRCWYRFSGVGAQLWFSCGDTVGFAADAGIFVFVPGRGTDRLLGGSETAICAVFVSRWSDMELSDRVKRLRSLRLCSQGSEAMTLTLSDPAGTLAAITLPAGDGESLDLRRRSMRTGRFGHVRARLQSRGTGRQRIFGLALYAVK